MSFKHNHDLKEDAVLDLQSISNHNSVNVAGKEYSLDGLEPLNVYTDNALFTLDNELQALPPVSEGLFVGTDSADDSILVSTNEKNEVETVDIYKSDGSDDHLVSIIPGIMATIKPGDLDPKIFEGLKFDADEDEDADADDVAEGEEEYASNDDGNDKFGGRLLSQEDPSSVIETSPTLQERALQSNTCSRYKIIEVAIVFDTTFCEKNGGFNNSKRKVERIVANASMDYYQRQGVCAKVRINNLEGQCNRNSDPYRSLVVNGDMSCKNPPSSRDILKNFGETHQRIRGDVQRRADAVHLFFGRTDTPGDAIGCAWINELCGSWAYGVNMINYTNNEIRQAVLFGHELGHNLGLDHVGGRPSNGAYIMASSIANTSTFRWSSTSINRLKSNLNRFSCVSTETGNPRPPTPAPPSPAPPSPSPGGKCGCSTCTPTVLNRNAGGHKVSARIDWLKNNRGRSETQACSIVCGKEFPNVCSECDPNSCGSGPSPAPPSPSPPSGGGFSRKFVLINPRTGKALDAKHSRCDDRTNIHLWDRNDGRAQVFHYHFASQAIVNVNCNKAIDISAARCNSGTNIQLYRRNGTGAQRFQFFTDQTIRSVLCRGKAIDIYKKSTARGTNIWLWNSDNQWDKKWKVVYV